MITKYNKFINESFFFKTYEEMLKDIDKSYLEMLKYYSSHMNLDNYNGIKRGYLKHSNFITIRKASNQSLKTIHLIIKLLNKFKSNITEEQLLYIITNYIYKTLDFVLIYGSNKIREYHTDMVKSLNYMAKLISIINRINNLNMDINIVQKDLLFVLYTSSDGYIYITTKKEADRRRAETIAKHADIDPLGEENWDD